jgi:hypothetical protein
MLFGVKKPGKQPIDVGELRKLVKQLDDADVPDTAIVRASTRFGGKLSDVTVDSCERQHGRVKEMTRAEEAEISPVSFDPK